jgi:hypothetical protein
MAKKIESDLELEAIALKETYEEALKEIRKQALDRGYAFLKPTEGRTLTPDLAWWQTNKPRSWQKYCKKKSKPSERFTWIRTEAN